MIIPNENWLRSNILLEYFHKARIRNIVVSPGSRNTPLAHGAVSRTEFNTTVIPDERSAAFFALGIAKQNNKPVVLICTSGTAAANYYPAVVEACQSRIPLMILTADRPAKLQDRGAPQTIDQQNIYGKYSNYLELPETINDKSEVISFLDLLNQYYGKLISDDHIPLQINCPFDEPIRPVKENYESIQDIWEFAKAEINAIVVSPSENKLSNQKEIKSSIKNIINTGNVAIVAGPDSCRSELEKSSLIMISESLNAPVFADIASGLRQHQVSLNYPDILLGSSKFNACVPASVIWIGAYPTSKRLAKLLQICGNVIRVQAYEKCIDPDGVVKKVIYSSLNDFAKSLEGIAQNIWQQNYCDQVTRWDKKLTEIVNTFYEDNSLPPEVSAIKYLINNLPVDSNIMLANSMSVRYVDMFSQLRPDLNVYANKGANGIDGIISTASGITYSSDKPTLLITGDLTFLHDINALYLVNKYKLPLTVLLLNNNGGGIFHYLPAYQEIKKSDRENDLEFDSFEKIFELGVNLNIDKIAEGFGIQYQNITEEKILVNKKDFSHSMIYELINEREKSHLSIKEVFKALSDSLSS